MTLTTRHARPARALIERNDAYVPLNSCIAVISSVLAGYAFDQFAFTHASIGRGGAILLGVIVGVVVLIAEVAVERATSATLITCLSSRLRSIDPVEEGTKGDDSN
jgi:hypothetical protein